MVPVLSRCCQAGPESGGPCARPGTCPLTAVPGLSWLLVGLLAALASCAPADERVTPSNAAADEDTLALTPPPPNTLRVATFNLRYDNPGDGENRWENRRRHVADVILASQASVIGTQEGLHHQVEWLDSALADHLYVGAGRDDGGTKGEFTAIFVDTTRFRVESSGTFWLSPTPDRPSVGWDAAMERICTYAVLNKREADPTGELGADTGVPSRLLVLNAHFDHVGEQSRLESAKLLVRDWIDRALANGNNPEPNEKGMPIVLLGDLNALPGSAPLTELTSHLMDAHAGTLPPNRVEGTFNGFMEKTDYTDRIDYILHSKEMHTIVYRIFSERVDGRFPSDHFPVFADIRLIRP